MRFRAVALLLGVLALTLAFAGSARAAFTPGSPGLGDPFFPLAGNGGYDVSHYSLNLSYEPAANQLMGTATIHGRGNAGSVEVRPRPARLHDLAARGRRVPLAWVRPS